MSSYVAEERKCPLFKEFVIFRRQQREVAEHIRLHDHGVKKHAGLPDAAAVEAFVEALPVVQDSTPTCAE